MGAGRAKKQGLKRQVKSLQWEPWVLKQRKSALSKTDEEKVGWEGHLRQGPWVMSLGEDRVEMGA